MAKENNEDFDSKNEEIKEEDLEATETEEDESEDLESEEDVEVLKEKNKHLYARAKKAEGFIQEDGKWVKKPKTVVEEKPKAAIPPKESDIDKLLDAKLEKRELESLDLSDELRKEVQTYAKIQGVSIKKALDSDYISFLKDKDEKKQRNEDASLGSKRRANTKKNYDDMTPSDLDLSSPEGKADFAKYEDHLKKQLG